MNIGYFYILFWPENQENKFKFEIKIKMKQQKTDEKY